MRKILPSSEKHSHKTTTIPSLISRIRWGILHRFFLWLYRDTVTPSWFIGYWRNPFIGYIAALLIQILMISITLLLTKNFPLFLVPGAFMILGTLFTALLWGAGPSLFAAILATIFLYFFLLQPRLYSQPFETVQGSIEVISYLLSGCIISVLASRALAARSEAESSRLHLELLVKQLEQEKTSLAEAERASAEQASMLGAIIDAVPDAIFFTDKRGRSARMNAGGRAFLFLEPEQTWQGERIGDHLHVRNVQGQLISAEEWPSSRILQGEVISANSAIELLLYRPDGQDRYVSITGGPLHDPQQQITGVVTVVRDITEHHILQQRTQETLEALLLLAENLVQFEPKSLENKNVPQYLVELICNVLNCERASLTLLDPKTGAAQSVAVVGLSPEDEQFWRSRPPGFNLREQLDPFPFLELLRTNDVISIDMMSAPFNSWPNPFHIRSLLLAPLLLGDQLLGVLSLDHGGKEHLFTENEQALAKAVSRLAALVIERERLLQERAEALANEVTLRETNRLMDEFVGIAGHELRTPLTTIKASIQLALRQVSRIQTTHPHLNGELLKQLSTIQGFLERAERQTTMQNRLVNDLLDISRIQANRLELHPALFDLAILIQETIEDQRHSFPERTIHLDTSPNQELMVVADVDRVRQVITNYLSNALKYSAPTTSVLVFVERLSDSVRVSVRDEGPGLSLVEQERIWERFYRVEGVEVRSGSGVGLGLGLHICRMIIERQNGQVGVQSTLGQGSTFWFVLPVALPSAFSE